MRANSPPQRSGRAPLPAIPGPTWGSFGARFPERTALASGRSPQNRANAAVSNVSIVSVASLVGFPQLGYYLTDGYQRSFPTEIIVGIVACVLLALIFDTVIRAGAWAITPWQRVAR